MNINDTANQVFTPLICTVANGGTTSNAVSLQGATACKFQTPSTITGTTCSFLGSIDQGQTFKEVHDASGTKVSYTVAADQVHAMARDTFKGFDYIKVVLPTQSQSTIILIKPNL